MVRMYLCNPRPVGCLNGRQRACSVTRSLVGDSSVLEISNRILGVKQISGPVDAECLPGEGQVLTASKWQRYGVEAIKVKMLRKNFLPLRV
jgi:hypothetical protein